MNWTAISIFVVVPALLFSLFYINDRWLIPWYAQRTVNKLLKDIKDGKPQKSREYHLEISFDSTGFSLKSPKDPGKKLDAISWSKIERVTAFKRDLITTDCICLLFALADGRCVELNEEMKGWPELVESMTNCLPGCKPLSDWIFDVASPAFATNLTEVYSRVAADTPLA
jgi:hypothetical protein